MAGSLPADARSLRRLIGEDANPSDITAAVGLFFPLCDDGRRRNAQHAEARDAAVRAYQATVRGGQMRAAQMWGNRSSANSSADS